ncbi:MAG: hypothetical protein PHO01_01735 [Desulfotomaculaceae bacterium]|nr:hypothetical protein [Desulfotomaculaceae bacterium]
MKDKVLQEIELPEGHIFVITDELTKRKTTLGRLVRDYMEKKNAAKSDFEKNEAIRNLFITVFDEIESGDDNLRFEFHMASARKFNDNF